MIKFSKPANLEGNQLRRELQEQGIYINELPESISIDEHGFLLLDIDEENIEKAQVVLSNHNPNPNSEPTIQQKLATVGLTIDELKEALGL